MNENQINAMVSSCLEDGFQLPITWCVVGINGAILAVHYVSIPGGDGEIEATVVARHRPESGFPLPAFVLVVDATNKSVRMVLEDDRWESADLN